MPAYIVVREGVTFAGVELEVGDGIDLLELPEELRGQVIMARTLDRIDRVRAKLAERGLYDVHCIRTEEANGN